ncbi:MAG: hypothetical protein M1824_006154 [Vezdaea acicularis]|nr:MAG: hypothetical protein M1824_006154 [Vezdaea acicularis]
MRASSNQTVLHSREHDKQRDALNDPQLGSPLEEMTTSDLGSLASTDSRVNPSLVPNLDSMDKAAEDLNQPSSQHLTKKKRKKRVRRKGGQTLETAILIAKNTTMNNETPQDGSCSHDEGIAENRKIDSKKVCQEAKPQNQLQQQQFQGKGQQLYSTHKQRRRQPKANPQIDGVTLASNQLANPPQSATQGISPISSTLSVTKTQNLPAELGLDGPDFARRAHQPRPSSELGRNKPPKLEESESPGKYYPPHTRKQAQAHRTFQRTHDKKVGHAGPPYLNALGAPQYPRFNNVLPLRPLVSKFNQASHDNSITKNYGSGYGDQHSFTPLESLQSLQLDNRLPPDLSPSLSNSFNSGLSTNRLKPTEVIDLTVSPKPEHAQPSANRWSGSSAPSRQERHGSVTTLSRPAPSPNPVYLAQSLVPHVGLNAPQPLLILLDLNGTILHRPNRKLVSKYDARPFVTPFLKYLLATHTVLIWSSVKPKNIAAICKTLFSKAQRRLLAGEWARDTLGLNYEEYHEKVQVYKQLTTVWADKTLQARHPQAASGGSWNQGNTVLIDDSALKASSEPHNLLLVPEFVGVRNIKRSEREDGIINKGPLEAVVGYLEQLRWVSDVSAFMRTVPFVAGRKWEGGWLGYDLDMPTRAVETPGRKDNVDKIIVISSDEESGNQ